MSLKRLCHNYESISQQGRYRAARAAENGKPLSTILEMESQYILRRILFDAGDDTLTMERELSGVITDLIECQRYKH